MSLSIQQHPLPDHGPRTVFGILVHTTGDGVPRRALAQPDKTHLEHLTEVYSQSAADHGTGPHYAIAPDGGIVQFRDPATVAWHAGVSADQRRSFLDFSWESDANRISPGVVKWWKAYWGPLGFQSPSHLYPSRSPNTDYIGIELMPAGTYSGNSWQQMWGDPVDNSRFSVQQYVVLARLCKQLAVDHGIDLAKPNRLVGHSDVNPYTRPGWDPGMHGWGFFSDGLLRGLIRCL